VEWRLFADVPEEDVRQYLSLARRRTFARGEVVVHRGDPGDSLHVISAGRFAIRVTTPVGETATLALLGPGEVFGELALFAQHGLRSATVSALEQSETYSLHRHDFSRLRREHPEVTEVVLAILAEQLRRTSERLVEALYVDAETRVRRRLLELADRYAEQGEPTVVPLTQEEIAALAGTSRVTVNRVLRNEQKLGSIDLRRGRVVVLARAALEKHASTPHAPSAL
jgi:CRP-like cAMP-binding protein